MAWNPEITVAAAAAISTFYVAWRSLGMTLFSLKQARTQRLYALAIDGVWRTADPLALQIAMIDAWRRLPPPVEAIKFAFEQDDPWRALRDVAHAHGLVKVGAVQGQFVDGRPVAGEGARGFRKLLCWSGYAVWIRALLAMGVVLFAFSLSMFVFTLDSDPVAAGVYLLFALASMPYCIALTTPFSAALRLLKLAPAIPARK